MPGLSGKVPDGDLASLVAACRQQGPGEALCNAEARRFSQGHAAREMQMRTEFYHTIDLAGYEALDASIVATAVPESA